MALKTLVQLLAEVRPNGQRQITGQNLADFANSVMAVAGTLFATNAQVDLTAAWLPFAFFTDSIDTKGLTPDIPNGRFSLDAGAGGVYKAESSLCFDSAFNGEVTIALVKNGVLTPYVSTYSVIAGKKLACPISGTGDLADGDTIGLGIKASGNATITLVHGSLIVTRI